MRAVMLSVPEELIDERARLGLDQPILLQYVSFLANALRGDWGVSMVTGQPVLAEVLNVLPWTIDLTLVSLALGVALGVPLGVWAAVRRNRFVDYVVRIVRATRSGPGLAAGAGPRGGIALVRAARAASSIATLRFEPPHQRILPCSISR